MDTSLSEIVPVGQTPPACLVTGQKGLRIRSMGILPHDSYTQLL
jgi:hypothetical protein